MRMKLHIKHDKRILIYDYILKYPYLHLHELARKLQIPGATLIYHLRYLEKNGFIISKKEGRYTRYYVANNINNTEKKLLNVFRQVSTRNVLLYIMLCVSASQIEIAKELEKKPKTIESHLKRLISLGIIERAHTDKGIIYTALRNSAIIKRKRSKNEIFYRIKEPGKLRIYITFLKYYNKKTINDPIVDSFVRYVEYIAPGDPSERVVKTSKQSAETLEKALFEIFPHPYYA